MRLGVRVVHIEDREPTAASAQRGRRRITVRGVVQGVGFRPFVYALARDLGLSGTVGNTGEGVRIEVEGRAAALAQFADRLVRDAPPLASDRRCHVGGHRRPRWHRLRHPGSRGGTGRTLVSPDVATCDDCLAELADPRNRRYRHPFITCTNCGPRFTIIVGLPYDRPATTMAGLPLCADLRGGVRRPGRPALPRPDRRLPELRTDGPAATTRRAGPRPATAQLAEARRLLAAGAVVAVKGLGGYHLACDAT